MSMSRVGGARKAAIPGYIEPCDPTLDQFSSIAAAA
jgi:hypothetical protein